MKKIGILTHYYKSKNYGGNLQAYALCEYLNNNGYTAEQICFDSTFVVVQKKSLVERIKGKGILGILKSIIRRILVAPKRIVKETILYNEIKKHDVINRRVEAFDVFNSQVIPHSQKVYNSENINESSSLYDIFITGSDQVWKMKYYSPIWWLSFVKDKTKISYAASLATDTIENEHKNIIKEHLRDFSAVSIREKSLVSQMQKLSPVGAEYVLDPTLLLEKEDWDKVCAEKLIEEDYIFCYFLGENKKERKLVIKFAKEKGLKLVTIPHASGKLRTVDIKFGDKKIYDASPQQFLSLIKHAKYIFTDSFHAVVFSNIYQKQYFVFNRNKKGEMSARITDITGLFGAEERFCNNKQKETLKYINSLKDIDYYKDNGIFIELIEKSIIYLMNNQVL